MITESPLERTKPEYQKAKHPEWFDEDTYRKKIEFLNKLAEKEFFDSPLCTILERFYKLPLNTMGSCSLYTKDGDPDKLD